MVTPGEVLGRSNGAPQVERETDTSNAETAAQLALEMGQHHQHLPQRASFGASSGQRRRSGDAQDYFYGELATSPRTTQLGHAAAAAAVAAAAETQLHDNPLLTLANSVPQQQQQQQEDESEWLSSADTAAFADRKDSVLAMQLIAQHVSEASGKQTTGSTQTSSSSTAATSAAKPDSLAIKAIKGPFGNKIFLCTYPDCSKSFSRKMNLVSHIQSQHEHLKPFKCDHCSKCFSRHSDRRRHEKSQHVDHAQTAAAAAQPQQHQLPSAAAFVCGGQLDSGTHWGCGKVFKRKDGLTSHWKSTKAKKNCFAGLEEDQLPAGSSAAADHKSDEDK